LFNTFFVPSATTATGNAGLNVGELDFIMATGTGNTVAGIFVFDNITLKFSATDTLLGVENNSLESSTFSVYPNPSKDFVYISNAENASLKSVEISNLNGRVVKNVELNNVSEAEINISDLSTGIYLIKMVSDKGIITKKLVKQ
jgi:hypothetical protein